MSNLNGVYKHFKHTSENPKIYLVFGVATDSETKEEKVIYKSLLDNIDDETFWMRDKEMFLGDVEVSGQTIKRFEKLDDDAASELLVSIVAGLGLEKQECTSCDSGDCSGCGCKN